MRLVITSFNLGLGACAMVSSTFCVICSSVLLLIVYPFLLLSSCLSEAHSSRSD